MRRLGKIQGRSVKEALKARSKIVIHVVLFIPWIICLWVITLPRVIFETLCDLQQDIEDYW